MTHKSIARTKKAIRKAHYDLAELRALLIFIETLLKASGHRVTAGRKARAAGGKHKKGRRLSVGLHRHVKVGKHYRTVRVLANGRWRFVKG